MSKLTEMMAAAQAEEAEGGTATIDDPILEEPGEGATDPGAATGDENAAAKAAKAVAAEAETNGTPPKPQTEAEKAEAAKAELAGKKPEGAKPEPTKEEKATAARFAALARQRSEIEDARTDIRRRETAIEGREAEARATLERGQAELRTEREKVQARALELEEMTDVFKDRAKFFDHVFHTFGITTRKELDDFLTGNWKPRPPPPAPVDPKNRPLTQAEFEALQAKADRERADKERLATERKGFLTIFDRPEYEAADTVMSDDEKYDIAMKVANAARAAKEDFTLADLADAVNEVARTSKRWQRVLKRGPQSTTAAGKPGEKSSPQGASQSTSQAARQSTSGTKTLANETATERAGGATNGGTGKTFAERRAAKKERLARLASS
jgi:hypothetical protein